mgnify:CR=1 FL=1
MRFRQDLLALIVCIIVISGGVCFQLRARNVYEIDGYGLDISIQEIENRLGPLKARNRGGSDEIWLTFGNSLDTEFLLNQHLKSFAVRGKSLWRNGLEVVAERSSESVVVRVLGSPAEVVPHSGKNFASRVFKYPKLGLEVVMMSGYGGAASGNYRVERMTLRRPVR